MGELIGVERLPAGRIAGYVIDLGQRQIEARPKRGSDQLNLLRMILGVTDGPRATASQSPKVL